MTAYNFNTLITAIDSKAQSLAASTTDPKDLVYLGKAIEAINTEADTVASLGLLQANNLSDLQSTSSALGNLGFQISGATTGQSLVYNATLAKFVNGTISSNTISSADPTTSTGDASSLGALFINTTSGEIFVCTDADATARRWMGTNGSTVGYPRGEFILYEANMQSTAAKPALTYTWTVPAGVTSFDAVCVGAGGSGVPTWASSAGGGGALAWANAIPVTAGDTILMYAGTDQGQAQTGGASYIQKNGTTLFTAEGGQYSPTTMSQIAKPVAGTVTPGNIASGRGGLCSPNGYGGGGGAGGYSGNGGNGGYTNPSNNTNTSNSLNQTINGTGGAASGGGGYDSSTYGFAGGGGVGLYGEGASGDYGTVRSNFHSNSFYGNNNSATNHHGGVGGSGGEDGISNSNTVDTLTHTFGTTSSDNTHMVKTTAGLATFNARSDLTGSAQKYHGCGGLLGGGGAGSGTSVSNNGLYNRGGNGGVRIMFGGGRSFPNNAPFMTTE